MRVDEYNSFESLLIRYRHALSELERCGVKVSEVSRLRVYERCLQQIVLDPRPAVKAELVVAVTFDLREIDEIVEIVEHLPDSLDRVTRDLLNKITGGSESPDIESGAAAREAQYELYLGTVFRRAGIRVRHGAPDLVASWHDQEFFLEAKRPSSLARVDDRLRSAVHQIRKLSSPGIIALSLDQVLRPSGRLLSVGGFDDLAPAVVQLVQSFVLDHVGLWRNRLTGEPVAALFMTARIPGRLSSTGHSVLGSNLHVEMLSISTDGFDVSHFIEQAATAYLSAQK